MRLNECRALDVFGGSGELHTKDYAPLVRSLEIWEVDPQFEPRLKRSFPEATVKIVDSYQEIKTASGPYELIVLNNPLGMHNGRCEHFDILPDVFRLAADSAVLVLFTVPWMAPEFTTLWGQGFGQDHLARRREFYKTETPENVPVDHMIRVYTEIIKAHGFDVEWHIVQKLTFSYHDLVFKISRSGAA